MDNKLEGFIPSCRIIFIPSIKNVTIKTAGNAITLATAKINRKTRSPMTASCDASHSEYWESIKNKKTARLVIIQKNETPLHNVLGSCSIILANMQNGIKKRINEICNISVLPL
ncbi:hypothetical protein AALB51_24420 [Lachnospiraceae bacterium 62-26]